MFFPFFPLFFLKRYYYAKLRLAFRAALDKTQWDRTVLGLAFLSVTKRLSLESLEGE